MRILALLPVLAAVLLTAACQSTEIRQPAEDFRAEPELSKANVADIVVMPIDLGPAVANESTADRQMPARRMRKMIRGYLIERKHYAAPREVWIDDQLSTGGDLDTDALLNVSVLQWDTSALEKRGVIYATANFELKTADGSRRLWHYTCRDYQLVVDGSHGGNAAAGNNISAARLLAETALSRLPRK